MEMAPIWGEGKDGNYFILCFFCFNFGCCYRQLFFHLDMSVRFLRPANIARMPEQWSSKIYMTVIQSHLRPKLRCITPVGTVRESKHR